MRDRLSQDILERIQSGNWTNCSPAERPYKMNRTHLMVDDSVLCCGECIVIPPTLRHRVLQMSHDETHSGVAATRNQLKLSAWWPGYCEDVETFVARCGKCSGMKGKPSVMHTWPKENAPWHRVHMDHAYIKEVGLILILVDAYSGWPEAVWVKDRSAETVKTVLRAIFARLGVPHTLVSDNAAEFGDGELMDWLNKIGCLAVKTPPKHPQSNGLAERMVQTIKKAVTMWEKGRETFNTFMARFLINFRSIPHVGKSQSPSQLMSRQNTQPNYI